MWSISNTIKILKCPYAGMEYLDIVYTVCPKSSDPSYIVSYFIKWVTTSWTDSASKNETLQVDSSGGKLEENGTFKAGVAGNQLYISNYSRA